MSKIIKYLVYMKKYFFIVLAILVLAIVGYFELPVLKQNIQKMTGANYSDEVTLVGSSSNVQNVPNKSEATTTVDQSYADAPDHIVQVVDTRNAYTVILAGSAKGATATSTLYVQVQGSNNGTDFFNIASSTTATVYNATSSILAQTNGRAFDVTPGTATSTFSKVIDNPGWNYMRFFFYDDRGVASHLNNIQAFLQVIRVSDFQ